MILYKKAKPNKCSLCGSPLGEFQHRIDLGKGYYLRLHTGCYKKVGIEVTMETTQSGWRTKHINEIARILNPNGLVMCFGWNSSGVGIKRGMELIEVLLVPHGGSHNDTIVTVERKIPTLF